MPTLVIDFDGTITHERHFRRGHYGRANSQIKTMVRRLWQSGWFIVVWTSRSWWEHPSISAFLEINEIPFSQVVCCKPIGDYYFDTKNLKKDELYKMSLRVREIENEVEK